MLNITSNIKKSKTKLIVNIFLKDMVFTLSLLLAIISSFVATPKVSYIDFKVLACLFNLMIIIKAFEELKLLDKFAISILNNCSDVRKLTFVLVTFCFFSSMLITNDVALLTFVPLTLIIGRKSKTKVTSIIILETIAANIGSSLTPLGNPQNLYIFSHYSPSIMQFFTTIISCVIIGGLWLVFLTYIIKNNAIKINLPQIELKDKAKTIIWTILFILIILSVLGIMDYKILSIIIIISSLILNRQLLLKVDYFLLMTFVCFFIFIGNLSSTTFISNIMRQHLSDTNSIYFGSILLSQLISNVPCAILLSKFTEDWRTLLIGVNIGGMGTLIASLASVISYKLFSKEHPEHAKHYMFKFIVYSFLSLACFTVVNYFIIIS